MKSSNDPKLSPPTWTDVDTLQQRVYDLQRMVFALQDTIKRLQQQIAELTKPTI